MSEFINSNHCAVIIEVMIQHINSYQIYLDFFRERSMFPFKILKDGNVIPMGDSLPDASISDGLNFAVNVLFLPS